MAVIILSLAIEIHCFSSQYFKLCVEIHLHMNMQGMVNIY